MKRALIACTIVLCMSLTPIAAFAIGAPESGAAEEPQAMLQANTENSSLEPQDNAAPVASATADQGVSCKNGYIDANGDNICDNYGSDWCTHHGSAYVDANNSGTCDNYESGQCPGRKACPQDATPRTPHGQEQGHGHGHGC